MSDENTTRKMDPAPIDPRRATTIKSVKQNVRGVGIIIIVAIALVCLTAGLIAGMKIGFAKGVEHAGH